MATMLIPGHDRDAIVPTMLTVDDVDALSDLQLATIDYVIVVANPELVDELVDEYEPTDEDLAQVRMFLAITPDVPDVVGYDDARKVLDQLAYDEWTCATAEAA